MYTVMEQYKLDIHIIIMQCMSYNFTTLEYSCNKYCDLIGQLEVSISRRDLQVFVTMGMEKNVDTITIATLQSMATTNCTLYPNTFHNAQLGGYYLS